MAREVPLLPPPTTEDSLPKQATCAHTSDTTTYCWKKGLRDCLGGRIGQCTHHQGHAQGTKQDALQAPGACRLHAHGAPSSSPVRCAHLRNVTPARRKSTIHAVASFLGLFVDIVDVTMHRARCAWPPRVTLARSASAVLVESHVVGNARQCATGIWRPPQTSKTFSGTSSWWHRSNTP
jgi:hypothetical protein